MVSHVERREQGIALIWAILIMLLVFGTVAVAFTMTMFRTDETKDNANRTRSALWSQAAADDIAQRLQSGEIGYQVANPTAADNVDQIWRIPAPTTQPAAAMTRFANGGSNAARRLTFTSGPNTYTGWYQVLPNPGTPAGAWQAVYRRSGTAPQLQGSVEALVRVWEDGRRAEPVHARLSFRRASYSRFSILADDKLTLGGVGRLVPGGFIHTNNARNEAPAIRLESTATLNVSQVVKITSTRGTISAAGGQCTGRCVANVRDVVEFGAAARAFDRVRDLSGNGRNVAHYVGTALPSNTTNYPVWWANIAGAGCSADQVSYGQGYFPLRQDTVGVPAPDDRAQPTRGPRIGCLNISQGGGAVLFNGDVVVLGTRSSFRPVTIMAQRVGTVTVRQDVDGVTSTLETTRVTAPASIFIDDLGSRSFGSTSSVRPIGLVAEGSVYVPGWYQSVNQRLAVNNVAAMAMGGEISYGPTITSIAATSGEIGLGILPVPARGLGYGYAGDLDWTGSLASRRQISFRYGGGNGCGNPGYLGWRCRDITYAPTFIWNAPPQYPTDRDWHLADYREFR